MSRKLAAFCAAAATAVAIVIPLSASTAQAADCVTAWVSSQVYTGGQTASHNGRNWSAKWWTQGETPGAAAVWADQGACGGSTTPPPGTCTASDWVAGRNYRAGDVVRYTDGRHYIAEHDNPGYDPTISTWYWNPHTCNGGTTTTTTTSPPAPGGFVVSEAQFNQMFPNRNPFYTYSGLTAAMSAYPGFAKTGSDTVRRQEAAAFLANTSHETGGLVHIVEQNQNNYPHYCDSTQPYGCPAGQAAYYGRGPIQLSWNFNYKAAGDALGLPLLTNPWLVQQDASVAWKTALWYWNTQNGPGTMTAHSAMVNSRGFGETIRSINGALECNGGNPAQVQSRVTTYQRFAQILGVSPGGNLYC
ncbi:glycoside hydrolase family 19 protein [Actinokineospora sp. UTMC 2448]|uniref:glycoside hydrolase family 19 protein n=1 Tax=Actinokineospora sp. UTMC 2448 TaxID=2268449 RepID=UPI002164BB44|nr:glycoside hydrolase family 19 protein [Actinokineospora sp. UTMC 2448]UVS80003.1 putative chitinase [Actinokineospora sp. UTMC 2448]